MATPARTGYPHIVKDPGHRGGKASIGDTGVRVMNVVFLHKLGQSDSEILDTYPDLTRAQVHAPLSYYYDHTEEIDAELQADEGAADRYEKERQEDLARRTAG